MRMRSLSFSLYISVSGYRSDQCCDMMMRSLSFSLYILVHDEISHHFSLHFIVRVPQCPVLRYDDEISLLSLYISVLGYRSAAI